MDRERTKTLILSLLVILSIMSLHEIWFDSPMPLLQSEASNVREIHTNLEIRNQVIAPRKTTIGFGGSISNTYYTMLNYQETKLVWDESKLLLLDFFAKEHNINVVAIDEYYANKQRKSIEFEFRNGIPSVLLSSLFNTMDNKITDEIRSIKRILIPTSNTGTIYIIGENLDGNVYQVSLENYENHDLENIIAEYKNKDVVNDIVRYYTLFSFVNNQTLMPLNYNQVVGQLFMESEIDIKNQQAIVNRTKSFFNENFDFVKSIRETSGSIIYLYGYGEKSVRINNRGYLSYNEEMVSTSSVNVLEALNVALSFIEEHDGMPKTAYLTEIKDVTTGSNRGYYFGFTYDIEGYPLANNIVENPLEIEVYGNTVKSYRRFIREKMNLTAIDPLGAILSPPKIMENNIEIMLEYYKQDIKNKVLNENETTDLNRIEDVENTTILENVNRVEMVYFDTVKETRRQLIVPSWLIQVEDRLYYFDCYDGKLLYSNIAN